MTRLTCPHCGKEFRLGEFWAGANYCRAAFLLPYIAEHPGLSAAEIAGATGLPYPLVSGGLQKARDWRVVLFESEEREQGGNRYRYTVAPDWKVLVSEWYMGFPVGWTNAGSPPEATP